MSISNVLSWLSSRSPMEPDLAQVTQRASAKDFVSACGWLVKKMPPREAIDAMRDWTRALNALPESFEGKILKASMVSQAGVNPLAVWVEQWSHARSLAYGPIDFKDEPDWNQTWGQAAWKSVGTQALDACEELWSAWGSEPVERAGLLRAGVDEALAQSIKKRGGKRDVQEEVEIWLSLGAVPTNGFSLALAELAVQPAAWRSAAALAARGARLGTDEAAKKQLRQWISGSLSDRAAAPRGLAAKERVEACLNLLGAGGWTLDSYRSKAGGHFDEMALGAVWSGEDADLAVALSQVNLRWSRAARARAPEHAARMLSKSLMSPEAILATLTAIDAGDGLGPWSQGMERLARQASAGRFTGTSNISVWLAPFGRWAVLGEWGPSDLAAAEKAFPALVKSPAWEAACEARTLAEVFKAVPQPTESKGVLLRPRSAL